MIAIVRPDTTKSTRYFCPGCKRERTGDTLTMPCACLRERERIRKKLDDRRRQRAGGDVFERLVREMFA